MRILFINDFDKYAGAEKVIYALRKQLEHYHIQTKLLIRPTLESYKDTLKSFKPDLVNLHNIVFTSLTPILYNLKHNINQIVTLHDYWLICRNRNHYLIEDKRICSNFKWDNCHKCIRQIHLLPEPKYLFKIFKSIKLICVSEYQKQLLTKFGYSPENIQVIYNGIEEPKVKVEYNDYLVWLYSPVEWKGIEIIKKLKEKLPYEIKIVGAGREDKLHPQYVSEKEKFTIISKSKLALFPSKWEEPFSIVRLEYLACKKVVLGFDIASFNEAVKYKACENLKSLIENIQYYFSNDKLCKQHGKENYRLFKTHFTTKIMADKYLKYIES